MPSYVAILANWGGICYYGHMPSRTRTQPIAPEPLAAAMRTERAAQGLSQRDAAARGGISTLTWSQVELAKTKPRDFTLAGVERGLGWPPGTAAGIMTGAKPPPPGSAPPPPTNQPLAGEAAPPAYADLAAEVAGIQALLVRVARHLGVQVDDDGAR